MEHASLWWRDGVIYQIYPRSFQDSNGDGIGDLPGIISRLDYLADLGVDAIWLSPIYPSPNVDFGYDVSDYTAIHPEYGTLQDFDELVRQAHQRGLRVIMDLVFNHTSDQHPWFLESRSSRDNPRRDWYIWRDGKGNSPPNNWQSVCGGRGWKFDPVTGQYYFHMFYTQQPDLNWRNPAVREAMLDVIRIWLQRGVDGFRLDVFNAIYKKAALPDNPFALGIRGFDRQKHIHDIDQPELVDFLKDLRKVLDAYPERYAVGETFLGTPSKAAGYCGSDRLHAAFNFAFSEARWSPPSLMREILRWEQELGPENWPNYVLGNHDVHRLASRLGGANRPDRLKVAAALLLTLRGTPYIYNGEEIGMSDISLPHSQILDPVGKKYWPIYKGRDGCRSPMQWDASPNTGFTQAIPWLPVHNGFREWNVTTQAQDENSLLNFYRHLLVLRRERPALQKGSFIPMLATRSLMAYQRVFNNQQVLVVLNFSPLPRTFQIPAELARSWRLLLSNSRKSLVVEDSGRIGIQPDEALLLEN